MGGRRNEALDVDLGDDCRFLVDLALIIEQSLIEPAAFAGAVKAVFAERDADAPPLDLPDPPGDWRAPYARMASEIGLGERTLDGAARPVRRFYLSAFDDNAG